MKKLTQLLTVLEFNLPEQDSVHTTVCSSDCITWLENKCVDKIGGEEGAQKDLSHFEFQISFISLFFFKTVWYHGSLSPWLHSPVAWQPTPPWSWCNYSCPHNYRLYYNITNKKQWNPDKIIQWSQETIVLDCSVWHRVTWITYSRYPCSRIEHMWVHYALRLLLRFKAFHILPSACERCVCSIFVLAVQASESSSQVSGLSPCGEAQLGCLRCSSGLEGEPKNSRKALQDN